GEGSFEAGDAVALLVRLLVERDVGVDGGGGDALRDFLARGELDGVDSAVGGGERVDLDLGGFERGGGSFRCLRLLHSSSRLGNRLGGSLGSLLFLLL